MRLDPAGRIDASFAAMKARSQFFTITALVVALATRAPAADQPPESSKEALAHELMVVLRVEEKLTTSLKQVVTLQAEILDIDSLTPEEREGQKRMMDVATEEVESLVSWEAIKPGFAAIYVENFSEDELRGLIEFFSSSVGQVWLDRQPEVQMATMQKMQGLIVQLQPQLIEAMQRATTAAETPVED